MAAIPEVVQLHEGSVVSLDGDIPIHLDDKIVIARPAKTGSGSENKIYLIKEVNNQSVTGYGISGKGTRVALKVDDDNQRDDWIINNPEKPENNDHFSIIRKTTVYCQPEELELAGEPILTEITKGGIEIDGIHEWLKNDRRVAVSGQDKGEKTFSECATLSIKEINKEEKYTVVDLTVDNNEDFILKRDTVKIYGNVVAATQGETRREVLGSGDGRKESQTFVLKQAHEKTPLTYVSAATSTGAESTLKVFVNDIEWKEAEILTGLKSTDQNFITKTDEAGKVRVLFGDGKNGARLPTGNENIKAEYRTGLGGAGNVNPGQISLLVDRPLGVKEVVNPIAAGGGSDKDKLEQARKNALRKIKALDRLISVQDYEDFACAYAGIGKAKAVEISNGKQQVVHVTVAGTTSNLIGSSSKLFEKLRKALYDSGDPQQKIILAERELIHIVLKAQVRILPNYQWEPVEMQLRSKLLNAFSYDRRELGQDVLLGEMYSIMQAVPGVDYVDVNVFGSIVNQDSDKELDNLSQFAKNFTERSDRIKVNLAFFENGNICAAQLAFFTPDVPETLILEKI